MSEAPKSVLRPLEQLCAEFRSRVGASANRGHDDDAEWELPPDEGSDCGEEGTARPIDSDRPGRSKLQRWYCELKQGHGAEGGTQPRSSSRRRTRTDSGTSASTRTGTVVKVVERKGFGFILPDGKDVADVMLHCSQLIGSSSSSRDDLHVGMRVRYQPETDARTGKKRAWCVTVLQVPDSVKSDNVSRRADREARASKAKSRAHESLDDEYLIGKIEERLSKESGFDDANDETFGESRGWSFEEAVAANARLAAGARLAAAKADWEYSGPPADMSVNSSDSTADGTPTGRSGGQSRSNSPDPCLAQAEEFLQGGWLPGYMLEGLQLQ